MHLKLLADESLNFRIFSQLKKDGFDIVLVLKEYQGISDKEVLNLSKQFKAIIITEDKDFGEWIFAHKQKNTGIIFLRYSPSQVVDISSSLVWLLNSHGISLYGKFVVVTTKKIRIREIV